MFTKGENGRKVNEGEKNWMDENILIRENKSILVAARSKAWVCRRSIAKLRVRNRPGVWMSFSNECCILSGRGLCDGLIPCPEESYPVYLCVFECVTKFVRVQQ
jgi:hypothetical protein